MLLFNGEVEIAVKTIKKELKVTRQMIGIYCRGKHKSKRNELCAECSELMDYVILRRTYCPFGDNKTFCSHCPIHCYRKDMRERIRDVMRYSGPRMLFYNPLMAISHIVDTIKYKKKIKNETKRMEEEDKAKESALKK